MHRRGRVDVGTNNIEPGKTAQKGDAIRWQQAARGRGCHAGSDRGIENIHVEAQIKWTPFQARMEVFKQVFLTPFTHDIEGDDLVAHISGMEDRLHGIDGATSADVDSMGNINQTLIQGVRELGCYQNGRCRRADRHRCEHPDAEQPGQGIAGALLAEPAG